MKRINLFLAMCLMLTSLIYAQIRTVTVNDTLNQKKIIIELHDTVVNGKKTVDTLSITTYETDTAKQENASREEDRSKGNMTFSTPNLNKGIDGNIVAIIGIIAVFGMPVFILFIVFFYRHKQRKAKYQLAEKILASGQQLPENFFDTSTVKNLRSKGISNICLGLGLFIFLWALTDEFSLGCIGLLILLTGVGQVIIHHGQHPNQNTPFIHIERNQTSGKKSVKIGGIEINAQQKEEQEKQ